MEIKIGDIVQYSGQCCRVMRQPNIAVDYEHRQFEIRCDDFKERPFDAKFLKEKGISEEVLDILTYLTHDKERVSYEDYIKNICTNLDAMLVKLADLTDNLDQGTLPVISEKDRERFVTYEQAKLTIMTKLAQDYPEIFKSITNARGI